MRGCLVLALLCGCATSHQLEEQHVRIEEKQTDQVIATAANVDKEGATQATVHGKVESGPAWAADLEFGPLDPAHPPPADGLPFVHGPVTKARLSGRGPTIMEETATQASQTKEHDAAQVAQETHANDKVDDDVKRKKDDSMKPAGSCAFLSGFAALPVVVLGGWLGLRALKKRLPVP